MISPFQLTKDFSSVSFREVKTKLLINTALEFKPFKNLKVLRAQDDVGSGPGLDVQIELDDTFGSISDRVESDKRGHLRGKGQTVERESMRTKVDWTDKSMELSPWGELEGRAYIIKAPQIPQEKGKKNPYKGIKRRIDPVMEKFGTSNSSNPMETIMFGVQNSRGTEELHEFLSLNSHYLKNMDVRKLLETCLENQQQSKVFDVLDFLETNLKKRLRSRGLTQMISICGRRGELEVAHRFFEILMERIDPEEKQVYPFNALMNAYGKKGKYEEAMRVMDRLRSEADGIEPDLFSFTSAIGHAHKASEWSYLLQLFHEMIEVYNFVPDVITFGSVAFAYNKLGKPWLAESLLDQMKVMKVRPDSSLYNTIISSYVRQEMYSDAFRMFREMETAGLKCSEFTYTSLMYACGRLGNVAEVERLYVKLLKAGFEPTMITFNALLETYTRNGEMDKAEAVFEKMNSSRPANIRQFTTLMLGYKDLGDFQKVLEVFDRVKASNLKIDERCCGVLVSSYLKENEPQKAEEFMMELWETEEIFPIEASNSIVAFYCRKRDFERALSYIETALEFGQNFDERTVFYVWNSFSELGQFQEMEDKLDYLLEKCKESNPEFMGVVTFVLAQEYGKLQMAKQAKSFFKKAIRRNWHLGLENPVSLYNKILEILISAEMWESIADLVKDINGINETLKPDSETKHLIQMAQELQHAKGNS